MSPRGQRRPRPVRREVYAIFFALFAAVTFLSHAPFINLPFFWDEVGQFIPAALDLRRHGDWIPHSAVPNAHPPGLMALLAAVWSVAGYSIPVTRAAMLLLASAALLVAFLLAIELCREARGKPALLAAFLLFASPLVFAQSMLAQLDMPAMLFTCLALLLFLQDRIALSAAVCVALVLVKETGAVAPAVFGAWLLHERRYRDAAWFVAPLAALAVWFAILAHGTGYLLGSASFTEYNVWYSLHPVRLAVAVARRLYYLLFANLHWVGALAIFTAWRGFRFRTRAWRVAWLLVAAHVAVVTLFGGAVLERYLLPALPVLYAAMVLGMSFYSRPLRIASAVVLLGGFAAANVLNPLYPFPLENNLAFTDFVRVQQGAAEFAARSYPQAQVVTAWPLADAAARPELGYVSVPLPVRRLPDFRLATLNTLNWNEVDVLIVFSREWRRPPNLLDFDLMRRFRAKFYGYAPEVTLAEARSLVPLTPVAFWESRGQWAELYVNLRRMRRAPSLNGPGAPGPEKDVVRRAQPSLGGEFPLPHVRGAAAEM